MDSTLVTVISVSAIFNLLVLSSLSVWRMRSNRFYLWLGLLLFATAVAMINNLLIYKGKGIESIYHISLILNIPSGAYLIHFINNLRLKKEEKPFINKYLFLPVLIYLPFLIRVITETSFMESTLQLAQQGKLNIYGILENMVIVIYSIGGNIYLLAREIYESRTKKLVAMPLAGLRKEMLGYMLVLQFGAFIPFFIGLDLKYIILYMPIFGQLFFLYCFFRISPLKIDNHEPEFRIFERPKYVNLNLPEEKQKTLSCRITEIMETSMPYLQEKFTLSALSDMLDELPTTVSMVINNSFKMSFNDYVNSYRIKKAVELLNSEKSFNLSIEGIAYECGFGNKVTFYNAFKKVMSCSPGEYRKNQKNKSEYNQTLNSGEII